MKLMMKSKKGMVDKVVENIILAIAIFALLGGTAGTLITQSNSVNTSGLPIANLFASDGAILTLFMIGIMFGMVKGFMVYGRYKK